MSLDFELCAQHRLVSMKLKTDIKESHGFKKYTQIPTSKDNKKEYTGNLEKESRQRRHRHKCGGNLVIQVFLEYRNKQ